MSDVGATPMLATLTDRRDFGDDWLQVRRRALCGAQGWRRGAARVAHRQGPDGHLSRGASRDGGPAARKLLDDGEVVAFDGEQTSFSRLQQRLGISKPSRALVGEFSVVYCVFDLLEAGGEDLTARPLVERRTRLEWAIRPKKGLQISEAWRDDAQRRYAQACRSGWEGLTTRRTGSGTRGRSPPATARRRSGSSVLGCASWRRPSRRSRTRGRSRGAPTGRGQSSWPRSGSPSGRVRAGCGSHVSSVCGTTSVRRMSSGSDRAPMYPCIGAAESAL
jgi:ATP dependent DNA ligase domain